MIHRVAQGASQRSSVQQVIMTQRMGEYETGEPLDTTIKPWGSAYFNSNSNLTQPWQLVTMTTQVWFTCCHGCDISEDTSMGVMTKSTSGVGYIRSGCTTFGQKLASLHCFTSSKAHLLPGFMWPVILILYCQDKWSNEYGVIKHSQTFCTSKSDHPDQSCSSAHKWETVTKLRSHGRTNNSRASLILGTRV